jgi:hypothetical protein
MCLYVAVRDQVLEQFSVLFFPFIVVITISFGHSRFITHLCVGRNEKNSVNVWVGLCLGRKDKVPSVIFLVLAISVMCKELVSVL